MPNKDEYVAENAVLKKENIELVHTRDIQAETIRSLREQIENTRQATKDRPSNESPHLAHVQNEQSKSSVPPDNLFGLMIHIWPSFLNWYKATKLYKKVIIAASVSSLLLLGFFVYINMDSIKRKFVINSDGAAAGVATKVATNPESMISPELGKSLDSLGIIAIWDGPFSPQEDARLIERIEKANDIKIIAYNLGAFAPAAKFQPAFKKFFSNPGSHMQVLLADPDDPFFIETASLQFDRDEVQKNLEEMKSQGSATQVRLRTFAASANRQTSLEIRKFKNQMRLPMIIIDNTFCVLTVRLPPHEAFQSMRLELISNSKQSKSYITRCLEHYDKVWTVSK